MRFVRVMRSIARRSHTFVVIRVALHLIAIVGLVVALAATPFVESYFTRGVQTGRDYDPIAHTNVNSMGINTFLNEEPDPEVVKRSLDMIAAGGFGYMRQLFGWYEIEPQPDVFTHSDGSSTWEKYDRIVNLAHQRGIEIIARLEKPPAWAKAGQPNPDLDGPPDNLSDYGDFVERFVSRYRGKVNYVQIWNEPNLEGEWGGGPIDPAAYVRLLEVGYRAAKRANPDVVVLLAGLAPTDQTGPHNLSDLLFLEQVYRLGGAQYFDIATCMVYGYGYSPFDRRVEWARNNFSRPIQSREIMVRHGDDDTPLWAVEYGWVALPDDWDGRPSVWGEPVSAEQQAEFLVDGYLRAQREWPWMGMMAVWTFRFPRGPADPDQIGNPTRGFAIVEHDFAPRPAYLALKRNAHLINRHGTGAYEFSAPQREAFDNGEAVTIEILGERLDLLARGRGIIEVAVDGERREPVVIENDRGSSSDPDTRGRAWTIVLLTIADSLSDGAHRVTLRRDPTADEGNIDIIGFVVSHRPIHTWIYPWITGALVLLLVLNLASAVWMARDIRSARRSVRPISHPDPVPQARRSHVARLTRLTSGQSTLPGNKGD